LTEAPIALVTAAVMPKPDPESGLVIDALRDLGLAAEMRVWDAPYDWARAPLVVSRTPWDYFGRPAQFLAWAEAVAACTTLVNPLAVLSWNAHKSYLVDLDRRGVPVVPTAVVAHGAGEPERAGALRCFEEVVIKPAISGGARGALRTSAGHEEAAAHVRSLSAVGDVLVQPFMSAVQERGESSLIYFDGTFSHAVRKLPAEGDFRVHEHYGGSVVAHEPTAQEFGVASATLAAAPLPTLYARIDLVDSIHGPLVMEAEMIEPELFLPTHPGAAERFAQAIAARVGFGV
jgi:glutathione synthase/RimK-type ligase-like ATP-grasp enzyme